MATSNKSNTKCERLEPVIPLLAGEWTARRADLQSRRTGSASKKKTFSH